ncbi:hypothetical protein Pmani_028491 [Petrolisthes manimaculis]|uniref:Uncharacterized protein n=1 Tax=Petrolisthes manimaculis TaxID=1843537 RepID=A0AAE1P208_9EUCA|nr:hypothetical protein Pmani_028491 [Petrolisthes manimaculis]
MEMRWGQQGDDESHCTNFTSTTSWHQLATSQHSTPPTLHSTNSPLHQLSTPPTLHLNSPLHQFSTPPTLLTTDSEPINFITHQQSSSSTSHLLTFSSVLPVSEAAGRARHNCTRK